jgi:hypothetical protein
MKTIKSLASITSIAIISAALCGCNTVKPYLTPAALTSEVSQGIQVGLDVYPAAAPDVAMARDVICTAALSSNTSPQAIVNDLQLLGITNSNSKLIVDAALLIYEGVYAIIGTNTTAVIQPYLTALCDGFTQGLPAAEKLGVRRKILSPHLK